MKSFREQTFAERRERSATARTAALERFRARPANDDPAIVAQRAARKAAAEAREQRALDRANARRAETERLAAEQATQAAAERVAREARQIQEAEEQAAIEAKRKAER